MSEQPSDDATILDAIQRGNPISAKRAAALLFERDQAREQARKAEIGRLAWTEIGAKAQSDARAIAQHADDLADAVEQAHEMRLAAEIDPTRLMELAAASYRLGTALASYRKARQARPA